MAIALFVMLRGWVIAAPDANRLTTLDGSDPFHPGLASARFTTPQWIGETNVEAVVILSIDDLRATAKYETHLRPVLERLKRIDGRAAFSIFCNACPTDDPQFATWLREGVSLEVHTLAHPRPLLSTNGFAAAANNFFGGKDYFEALMAAFDKYKNEHIAVYGPDNHLRLTGLHETQSIDKFNYGVANRGASIRVPHSFVNNGYKGYLEDRRPNSQGDPYKIAGRILQTIATVPTPGAKKKK